MALSYVFLPDKRWGGKTNVMTRSGSHLKTWSVLIVLNKLPKQGKGKESVVQNMKQKMPFEEFSFLFQKYL